MLMHDADHRAGMDILDRVKQIAGGTGKVRASYGGLEITIEDEATFPWHDVMHAITDVGQDIWVKRTKGQMIIRSKPPAL